MAKPDPKKPVKAIAAGLTFAAGWCGTALADGHVSVQEGWSGVVGLILAVGLVYGLRNPEVPE
jgi:hypothetical protein